MVSEKIAAVSGPMSRPFQPSAMPPAPTIRVGAVSVISWAITTSTGTCTRPVSSSRLAVLDPVRLHERVADAVALRGEEREGHGAADEDRVAPLEQRADHTELVAHLGAAEHGRRTGASGASSSAESTSTSRSSSRPAADGSTRGGPTIDACARCDAPNASFT